jgi:hypothetical protein
MKKAYDYRILDKQVIAVASATPEVGDWAAYIGAVAGKNHEEEWEEVRDNGSKLSHDIARILFPHFDKKFHWRD